MARIHNTLPIYQGKTVLQDYLFNIRKQTFAIQDRPFISVRLYNSCKFCKKIDTFLQKTCKTEVRSFSLGMHLCAYAI